MMFANPLHRHTPILTVIEPRGELSRNVTYLRIDTGDIQAHVTRTGYDIPRRSTSHWDPRMWAATATNRLTLPNVRITMSLSGATLLEASTDSGRRAIIADSSGRPCHIWTHRSARRIVRDGLGRPTAIHERMGNDPERCAERFTYAGADAAAGCAGRLVRHDDPAGTRIHESYGVGGDLRRDTRHFLVAIAEPDWPEDIAHRTGMVEADAFTTVRLRDALGETFRQTDAFGNTQRVVKHPDGQVRESWLRLTSGTDRCVADNMAYNAAGQLVVRILGNGATTTWTYDATDGRLLRLYTRRTDAATLQDISYTHDPTRRILSIDDATQPTRIFAGRRIDAKTTFRYDSLYRLIEATGIEQAGATNGPGLPAWQPFPPGTPIDFRRTYRYDASGNLVRFQHAGASTYGRTMVVAPASNRSLPESDSTDTDIDEGFDASGNLRRLQPGQEIAWNGLEQLAAVRLVRHPAASDDIERHVYDGDGERVRKYRNRRIDGRNAIDEVRYLPGLEVRSKESTGEELHVIQGHMVVGSAQVLHWLSTTPAGLANDAYRYTQVDHLGSCAAELDDAASMISQEFYYPFGGTSYAATRHALEADYRVRRHASKERDASGLYYYGSRYYAPWLHRWTQPDPAGIADGLNRYAFVHDDPVNHIDVQGRNTFRLDNFTHNTLWRPDASRLGDDPIIRGMAESVSGTRIDIAPRTWDRLALADKAIHLTRQILPYGAPNQAIDVLRTNAVNQDRFDRRNESLESIVRSGTGQCGEHAEVTFSLLSQIVSDAPLSLVHAADLDHDFVILGDRRAQAPTEIVMADSWVTYPMAHLLSESKFQVGEVRGTVPPGATARGRGILREWTVEAPETVAAPLRAEAIVMADMRTGNPMLWNEPTSTKYVGATYFDGSRTARYDHFPAEQLRQTARNQRTLTAMHRRLTASRARRSSLLGPVSQ